MQDPVTKSQRLTDFIGGVSAIIDLDPWGGETARSWNGALQPRKYTTYERDGNSSDEAMMRRYNRWHSRFDQPDPADGSYNFSNPQSFNRYAYVGGDPVNFVDSTGLDDEPWDPGETLRITTSVPGLFGAGGGGTRGNSNPEIGTNAGTEMGDVGGAGPQNTPCERRLAATFSDDPNARFVDVTDGDGYDPIIQQDRTFSSAYPEEHNHLYNAADTPKKNTNVFAPGGGRVIGSGVLDGQNWMSVYYRNLGGVSNVVLQLWHVENYNGRGGTPQGGRILLGQMGQNGNIRYGGVGSPEGWHVHIQAFSWWGRIDRRGRLIGNALGAKSVRNNYRLRLSDIFCR